MGGLRGTIVIRNRSSAKRLEDRRVPPAGEFKASDSLFTLGRKIGPIWSDNDLYFALSKPPNTIPPLIRDLIHQRCDTESFDTVRSLCDAYFEVIGTERERM